MYSYSMIFTHKEHVYDWEVDSEYLPRWTALLRDGKLKHLPVCTKELVCIILDRVEVVIKT